MAGLTQALAEHLGLDPHRALTPRLIATLANGATRCAIDAWVASGGEQDLRALAEEALARVRPAIEDALSSVQATAKR